MKNIIPYSLFEKSELTGDSKKIFEIISKDCKKFLDEFGDIRFFRGFNDPGSFRVQSGLGIYKVDSRRTRQPKDTRPDVSKLFDDEFERQFNIRPRSEATYVCKGIDTTKSYGQPMLFFPIGEYKYLYNSDVADLFTYIQDTPWYLGEEYWWMTYGDESENGYWIFGDIQLTEDYFDSIKYLKKNYPEFSNMSVSEIERIMRWVPEVSYEEWKYDQDSIMEDDINFIVSGYKNTKLKEWIESSPTKANMTEVMFLCNGYYLVDANQFI
jgi:hypothetical protein